MATVNQIVNMLYAQQSAVSKRLGSYVPSMSKESRVMLKLIDATIAIMHQALVDHGIYTDAELQQRLATAAAGAFVEEPETREPPPPDAPVPP